MVLPLHEIGRGHFRITPRCTPIRPGASRTTEHIVEPISVHGLAGMRNARAENKKMGFPDNASRN